ncbi:hypothetical protein [Clostridium sp. ZS2-4]|uniref:hypothetical protein n=1 Tax=Clostridium sp. ZS2-4 TaxID=2987703 RepID=UPI00227A3004|nr:hypothetical protein [Clostridium sp. ZS2-4]MCY6356341.1 hypothetical protein [Clostridium sp. ZS2-4]
MYKFKNLKKSIIIIIVLILIHLIISALLPQYKSNINVLVYSGYAMYNLKIEYKECKSNNRKFDKVVFILNGIVIVFFLCWIVTNF